jgi:hypothetical protein
MNIHAMLVRVLVVSAAAIGCSRPVDLARVRELYARWEQGWRTAQSCLLGNSRRSRDPIQQLEIAMLLHDLSGCPEWFTNVADQLPRPGVRSVDPGAAAKAILDNENAVNIWTELAASDVTDEVRDEILRLTDAVTRYRELRVGKATMFGGQLEAFTTLISARAELRRSLGYPTEIPELDGLTLVTVLERGVASQLAPQRSAAAHADWQWPRDGSQGTIVWKGKSIGKVGTEWNQFRAIDDSIAPLVWATKVTSEGAPAVDQLLVYQLTDSRWQPTVLENVVRTDIAERWLDVLFRAASDDDPQALGLRWRRFQPGRHGDDRPVPRLGEVTYTCATERSYWIVSKSIDREAQRDITYLDVDSEKSLSLGQNPVPRSAPACSDAGITYKSFEDIQILCTFAGSCTPLNLRGDSAPVLIGDRLAIVQHMDGFDPERGQLIALRADNSKERIFRILPGWWFAALDVRDSKPVLSLDGKVKAAVELPWPPEETVPAAR